MSATGPLAVAAVPRRNLKQFSVRMVRSLISLVGAVLGSFAWFVVKVRREEVMSAMRRCEIEQPYRLAREMYQSLGVGLAEILAGSLGIPLRWCADFDRSAVVDLRALAGEGGIVLACAHTGNWDLAACHAASELRLLLITKRLSVRWLDGFWQWTRARRGILLAQEGNSARRAREHLAKGGVVVAMIDQAPERRRGAAVGRFFDRKVGLDLAPALLAMRARVPMVVALPRRRADGSYTVDLPTILVPPNRPLAAWPSRAMQEATDALEQFIRDNPSQWLWLHRRWKPWPPGESSKRRRS